jgi:Zn finger protein HypA/HybF involved in hydrogenase expression
MKDGICPKCNAKEVHVCRDTAVELSIRLGMFSSADVGYYICANCGYVEIFVENKDDLPKIAEKYPKVYPKVY